MAETIVSITAANVLPSTGAKRASGTAGEAITAGQALYRKASDQELYLCDVDTTAVAADSEANNCVGIALNTAGAGQPVFWQTEGVITIGGTVTEGEAYVCSAETPGGIALGGSLAATDWVTHIGTADTAGSIHMAITKTVGQQPGV